MTGLGRVVSGATLAKRAVAASDIKSGATMAKREEDPATQVARVVAAGGPLMERAKYLGLAKANGLGQFNSSMAVGHAMDSVLEAASPIGLQAAEQAATAHRQAADIRADQKSQERQIGADRMIAQWNLDASDREKAAAMLTSFTGNYETALANINANENLKAEDRTKQIEALNARRDKQFGLVRDLYDVDISWGSPAAASSASSGKAASASGTASAAATKKATGRPNGYVANAPGVKNGATALIGDKRVVARNGYWVLA